VTGKEAVTKNGATEFTEDTEQKGLREGSGRDEGALESFSL
jgi:hypothetical protein